MTTDISNSGIGITQFAATQTSSTHLLDKTDFSVIDYNQDFELSLDDDLRLQVDTFLVPDGFERDNLEQAF